MIVTTGGLSATTGTRTATGVTLLFPEVSVARAETLIWSPGLPNAAIACRLSVNGAVRAADAG